MQFHEAGKGKVRGTFEFRSCMISHPGTSPARIPRFLGPAERNNLLFQPSHAPLFWWSSLLHLQDFPNSCQLFSLGHSRAVLLTVLGSKVRACATVLTTIPPQIPALTGAKPSNISVAYVHTGLLVLATLAIMSLEPGICIYGSPHLTMNSFFTTALAFSAGRPSSWLIYSVPHTVSFFFHSELQTRTRNRKRDKRKLDSRRRLTSVRQDE